MSTQSCERLRVQYPSERTQRCLTRENKTKHSLEPKRLSGACLKAESDFYLRIGELSPLPFHDVGRNARLRLRLASPKGFSLRGRNDYNTICYRRQRLTAGRLSARPWIALPAAQNVSVC